MSVKLTNRRFTVDEFHRMVRAGALSEDERIELIDGEIVEMAPIGKRHVACVDRLTELFSELVRKRAIVRVQGSIPVGIRSEPQPDLVLLRRNPDFYAQSDPGPADILLVVEVGDTSAGYDRDIKLPFYARAGLGEIWLVDLQNEIIEVYRHPVQQGYHDVQRFGRGHSVSPLIFADVTLAVDQILGESTS